MPISSSAWLLGYIPDIPTPFDTEGRIDIKAFAALCERQISSGVPALVICDLAGEAWSLSAAERELLIRTAIDVARGRARIIAGAGSNATDHAIELARRAEAAGADAVLSMVPYYNKPMQEGICAHFAAVAGATGLPVIMHDAPAHTNRPLSDDSLLRLSENRRFIGLRDGSDDVSRPLRLSGRLPAGFRLLAGDDATSFGYIASGGDGCISQISNIAPDLCRAIFANIRHGRLQSARYLRNRLVELEACLSRESPAALKFALGLFDLMEAHTRLPIAGADEKTKTDTARALATLADEDLTEAAEA